MCTQMSWVPRMPSSVVDNTLFTSWTRYFRFISISELNEFLKFLKYSFGLNSFQHFQEFVFCFFKCIMVQQIWKWIFFPLIPYWCFPIIQLRTLAFHDYDIYINVYSKKVKFQQLLRPFLIFGWGFPVIISL